MSEADDLQLWHNLRWERGGGGEGGGGGGGEEDAIKARLSDKAAIIAAMKEGYPHGAGQYVHGELSYDGELERGRMHGKGVLMMRGMEQVGNFVQGEFQEGLCAMSEGWTYVGNTLDGCWRGGGLKMKHRDGDEYDGDVEGGVFHGVGVLSSRDGRKFRGVFEQGKKSGPGRMLYPTGVNVQANFHKERMQGSRSVTFPNGTLMKISDQHEDGSLDVHYEFANGLVMDGRSEASKVTGACSLLLQTREGGEELPGFEFRGEMRGGELHGSGMLSFGKMRYEGRWNQGVAHGQGTLFERGNHSKATIPLRVTSYMHGQRDDAHLPSYGEEEEEEDGKASDEEIMAFEDRTS
eukprot:759273-Hanusia_phi.AAC.4